MEATFVDVVRIIPLISFPVCLRLLQVYPQPGKEIHMSVVTCPSSLRRRKTHPAKRLAVLCAAMFSLLALMHTHHAAAETVVNSSFETPVLGSGFQYNPSTPGIGWTFNAGSGIQGNGSAWGAANAPDGVQAAFIQNLGAISQAINFSAGNHTLSFEAASRATNNPPGSMQPINVTLDGQSIGVATPASTSFGVFAMQFSIATAGMHTLAFTGTLANPRADRSTLLAPGSLT